MTTLELKTNFLNNDLLPVCAWCGSIRNKQNVWQKVNLRKWQKLRLKLTHGICPECAANLI